LRLVALLVPAGLILGLGAFAGAACNASPAQDASTLETGADVAVCVLTQVFAGITDPASLLSCTGATLKLIAQIIDDALNPKPTGDAGLAALLPPYTPTQLTQLRAARLAIVTALAAKAGGK
jgi:hypothetical protein